MSLLEIPSNIKNKNGRAANLDTIQTNYLLDFWGCLYHTCPTHNKCGLPFNPLSCLNRSRRQSTAELGRGLMDWPRLGETDLKFNQHTPDRFMHSVMVTTALFSVFLSQTNNCTQTQNHLTVCFTCPIKKASLISAQIHFSVPKATHLKCAV